MNINIETIVLQNSSFSSTAKLLYGVMNSSKDENNICTKTAQELSEMIGCHRNSVVRAVEELADFGIVEVFTALSIKNRPKYTYKILDEDSLINKWAQKEIEEQMDKCQGWQKI